MKASVVYAENAAFTDVGGGVSRRILSHNPDMMVVEVRFETGAVGKAHTHPHVQSTYVKSGKFEFTIDGAKAVVCAGDAITFDRNAEHGTRCLEAGTLIDIFSPMREDFL